MSTAPWAGALTEVLAMAGVTPVPVAAAAATRAEADDRALVIALFEEHGRGLVRMARLFVDDRNAAEDLVQEAFIRLARSTRRIRDERKAAA